MTSDDIKTVHPQKLKRLIRESSALVEKRKKRNAQILELREAGLTIEAIAEVVGISKQRVSQLIIKMSNTI